MNAISVKLRTKRRGARKSACATRLPATVVLATCVVLACCAAVAARGPQSSALKDVLNRLDRAAKTFHAMSAQVSWTKHTVSINDTGTQTGVAYQGKTAKGPLGRIDIAAPDKKAYAFEGRTVQIYLPNIKEVQIYDTGSYGDQLERFLMLGFGTSGTDLERSYELHLSGTEDVNGEKTFHLVLIPKSEKAKKLVKQVDLWISDRGYYPVQEKILEPSDDYNLLVFSDVQINPPLKDADLRLQLPAGVKKVYPQKEK